MAPAPELRGTQGEQFLHAKDSTLHRNPYVELEQTHRQVAAEHGQDDETHAKPAEKIADWMEVLERTHSHHEDPRVLERIKESYHRQYVIRPENVPESAFELEARIARQMGYGDVPITDEFRHSKTEQIIADQTGSLDRWVNYLSSPDATYPTWAKYWAFTSMLKMGKFEKTVGEDGRERARFAERTRDTVAPFPPLNPRALALTINAIVEHASQRVRPKSDRQAIPNTSARLSEAEFKQLVTGESFSKLYTQFLIELPAYSTEGLRETRGRWVRYPQNSDAQPLVDSLEGYPLEWCTAGLETARTHLTGGDFYVYYSLDEEQMAKIPRVAIRMMSDQIAEVRGIAPNQHLDPFIADVVAEKMAEFPDGQLYQQRAADMARMTALDEAGRQGRNLTADDLRFLYEIDRKIQGFGDDYGPDPRIAEIRAARGEHDLPELGRLVGESLAEQAVTAAEAYTTIAGQLKAGLEQMPTEQVRRELADKLAAWESQGVMQYLAERLVRYGERYTLVATPNIIASVEELIKLANFFGEQQPYGTHVYRDIYDQYSAQQLSGSVLAGVARYSLVPSQNTAELGYDSAARQLESLRQLQEQHPELRLHVPSVLEALAYWQALRSRGDKLDDNGAFDRTYIRHFDLEPKRLGGFASVPRSYVDGGGQPGLGGNDAEDAYDGRVAVG